jgi:hypothetical protein
VDTLLLISSSEVGKHADTSPLDLAEEHLATERTVPDRVIDRATIVGTSRGHRAANSANSQCVGM